MATRHLKIAVLLGIVGLLSPPAAFAQGTIVTSTFSAGSEGWQPWATSTNGALSPGNPYLNLASTGFGTAKSKLITFNPTPEWTGDYVSAGVTHVLLDVANMSADDTLKLRLAVGNRASPMEEGGTWWVSRGAVSIPTSSAWTNVSLSLLEADLIRVGNEMGQLGTDSYEETFSDIRAIRILSANVPLAAIGDEFIGPVAMDNVSLVGVPEPSGAILVVGGALALLAIRVRQCTGEPGVS